MTTNKRRHLKSDYGPSLPTRGKVQREISSHLTGQGRPKVAYLSESSAQARAAELGMHGAYRCVTCGLWHVGRLR